MARTARGLLAAALLATVVACSRTDTGSPDPAEDGDRQTASTTAPGPSMPTGRIREASVVVAGDEVWIVGGVAGESMDWEANPSIIRRDADGAILGTIPLDLDDGAALVAASPPVTIEGVTYLVGFTCDVNPDAENGPCVTGVPAVHRVDDGGLVPLDVPRGWGTGPAGSAGSFGHPPWVVGSVGSRVVTSAAVGEGIPGTLTTAVGVTVVDLSTATAVTIPTVPGVLDTGSVCADGARIWSLVAAVDDELRVTGADVWVQDDPLGAPDAPPRHLATLTLDAPRRITGGTLVCGDGFVVVAAETDGGAFAILDTDTGELVGDVGDWDGWRVRLGVPPGGDGTRVVESRVADPNSYEPVVHRLVTRDGLTPLPDGDPRGEMGLPALATVELGGRLLAIDAWLDAPDVEQPPIRLG